MALVRDVIHYASRVFGVPVPDIVGRSRKRDIMAARQAVYLVSRQATDASLPHIGNMLRRHHTSVWHGVDMCIIYMQRDPVYRAKVRRVRKLARRGKNFAAVGFYPAPEPVVVAAEPEPEISDMDLLSMAVARYAAKSQSERMSA